MKHYSDHDYETDEILGKYLDTDEEAAEQRRLLNDDILGKYMRETPSAAAGPDRPNPSSPLPPRSQVLAERAAAAKRRRRRRAAAGILTAAALTAFLVFWQHRQSPLAPSDLTEEEASAAREELEQAKAEAATPTDMPETVSAVTETPVPTPTPDISHYNPADDWCLLLVSAEHPMPEGYAPEVVLVENDQYTDARCYDALLKMLTDCRVEGLNPLVISGHRTHELQELYFNNMTDMYMAAGEDRETAEKHAAESVAIPGTSEHELGLSVDIGTTTNYDIDESQLNEPAQQWLMENCWKYGYIVRYPTDKSDITGIIFEPWHYRYVGETAARVCHEENLCLEEYLDKYVKEAGSSAEPAASSSQTETAQPDSSSSVLP